MAKTKPKVAIQAATAAELKSPPRYIPPQKPADKKAIPEGKEWIHEIKYDGWRLQARIENGQVTLRTPQMFMTQTFRLVAEELGRLRVKNAIFDGEITAPGPNGVTYLKDFNAARGAHKKPDKQRLFAYFVFDLLFLNGNDLTGMPLIKRKQKLERLLKDKFEHVRYVEHLEESAADLMEAGRQLEIEGYVSKDRRSPYRAGGQGSEWQKFKFRKTTHRTAQP